MLAGCGRKAPEPDVAPNSAATASASDHLPEGIDWFEACGSPTTVKELIVL